MDGQPLFRTAARVPREAGFYLMLVVAGYFTLALVFYCFGFEILTPVDCDVPQCWDRAYRHNPGAWGLLIPGIVLGLLGLLQLRLDRRCTSAANRRILLLSFRCSAFAIIGICVGVGLAGLDGIFGLLRGLVGLMSLGLLLLGIVLSLVNLTWNLLRPGRLADNQA